MTEFERSAYHEAGHALCYWDKGIPTQRVSEEDARRIIAAVVPPDEDA